MKKVYIGSAIVIVVAIVLVFCFFICKKQTNTQKGQETKNVVDFFEIFGDELEGYEVDKDKSLDELLTARYSISELTDFFSEHDSNDDVDDEAPVLTYTEVNNQFPVEVLRPEGYSVYEVEEGGYYYVFWERIVDMSLKQYVGELYVDNSVYIAGSKGIDMFNSLEVGVSTAADVRELDQYVGFNSTMSHAIYSYCYLNKDDIVEIVYDYPGDDAYEENYIKGWFSYLIIEELNVIPREEAMFCVRIIDTDDLP